MEYGILGCPVSWETWLPQGVQRVDTTALNRQDWKILAATERGCSLLRGSNVCCRTLLVPGTCTPDVLDNVQAEFVIPYGLSSRDSLTLSSLKTPVLCVQRMLPRPDGGVIEPCEIPLPALPAPAEELLPLLALYLLRMQLTDTMLPW